MSWVARHTERERRRAARFAVRLPGWRTRRRRRQLALLWALFPIALVALVFAGLGPGWFPAIWLTVYLGWLAVLQLLRVLTLAIADSLEETLDERQRQLRDQAVIRGYQFGLLTLIPLIAYLLIANGSPDVGMTGGVLLAVDLALVAGAPTALLAWALPDDDPEDYQGQ